MPYKLVRFKDAPPGHAHFKGRTIYDPAKIAEIESDPHLARTYQRAALTPDEAEHVASFIVAEAAVDADAPDASNAPVE